MIPALKNYQTISFSSNIHCLMIVPRQVLNFYFNANEILYESILIPKI